MARSFGTGELLFLLKAIPWTLALSLGALLGGGLLGLVVAILRVAPARPQAPAGGLLSGLTPPALAQAPASESRGGG